MPPNFFKLFSNFYFTQCAAKLLATPFIMTETFFKKPEFKNGEGQKEMTMVRSMTQESSNLQFKTKKDLHLARKAWHICGVMLIFVLFSVLPLLWSQILMAAACLVFIPLDLRRIKDPRLNAKAFKFFGPIMRQREKENISGMSYLFVGVMILLLFFEREVVQLSLLFLAFADPIAAYVGVRWGKDKITENKSLQGFFAAFAACAIATFVFLYYQNLGLERIALLTPLCGFSGAFAEALPLKNIDDNFTLPCLSAILLTILFFVFSVL